MILFPCPSCQKQLKAHDQFAGKRCQCTGCKQIVNIPPDESTDYESIPAGDSALVLRDSSEEETEVVQEIENIPFLHRIRPVRKDSLVIFLFQWLLIILAAVYSVIVLLAIVTVGTAFRQKGDLWLEVTRGEGILEYVGAWILVMLLLGALYSIAEIAKNSRGKN